MKKNLNAKHMKTKPDRRSFLKSMGVSGTAAAFFPAAIVNPPAKTETVIRNETLAEKKATGREYNGSYTGEYLNRVAFPMGGLGAGMICMEGCGALSHVSVKNKPEMFNEPGMFAAIAINGIENGVKVLEGPVYLINSIRFPLRSYW